MRDNFRIGEKYLFRRGISVIIPVKDIRLVEFGKGTGVHGGYTWCGVKAENRNYAGCICARKEAEELFEALKQKNPDIFWNEKTV